jgi:hypothetical protein
MSGKVAAFMPAHFAANGLDDAVQSLPDGYQVAFSGYNYARNRVLTPAALLTADIVRLGYSADRTMPGERFARAGPPVGARCSAVQARPGLKTAHGPQPSPVS